MRFIVDICHPAHVHFFRYPIEILSDRGHEIVITSRIKDVAIPLMEKLGWDHIQLSRPVSGPMSLLRELVQRNTALYRLVRETRPDAMAAIGGIFVAQVGFLTRRPSIVFYDTENARLQNILTYPFASRVVVPECYSAWVPEQSVRYRGYHELSYLHPKRFIPDVERARANGISSLQDNYLVRLVAWKANHDIGEQGWSDRLLSSVVGHLSKYGNVIISSELRLPPHLQQFEYRGDPSQMHHVMSHCRLVVSESATMASEAAVLGVPAVYAAETGRGYTDELEARYSLVRNVHDLNAGAVISAIEELRALPPAVWSNRRANLLDETRDVAEFVADEIEALGTQRNSR